MMKNKLTIKCQNKTLQCVFPIIEYDGEPILMVMQDDFDDLFLSLCSDFRAIHRWIVAPTRIEILHRLVDFEITINDALRAVSRFAYVVECQGREYHDYKVTFDSINPLYLAEEGVFADFIEEDCDDNLANMETACSKDKQSYYVASISRVISDSMPNVYLDITKPTTDGKSKHANVNLADLVIQMKYSFSGTGLSEASDKDVTRSFAA